MIRWTKVRTVATFEFLSTVKRKGYLIATFGMPLFLLAYGALIGGMISVVEGKESQVKIYGVIDRAGVLDLSVDLDVPAEVPEQVRDAIELARSQGRFPGGGFGWLDNIVFRPFDDDDDARASLAAREIKAYFVLERDYLETGELASYSTDEMNLGSGDARERLAALLQQKLLEGRVPEDVAERSRDPIVRHLAWVVEENGEVTRHSTARKVLRLVVPVAFGLLLMISLMMTSQIMVQGTAVEKENKVVEVLLSAANPDEILAGKLLGLGLSGLLQVMVWFSMAFAGSLMFAAALAGMGFELPWAAVGVGIVLFIAAYLFLGSLMLGTGSLGNNLRESQQYNMVWTLLTVFPMVVISILMADPHGTFGRVMTWIPFTAPLTIILRMTLQPSGIAWWEIAGPILVLLLATWFSIRLGARLFRVGLLLSGNRPSFREILRQARLQ